MARSTYIRNAEHCLPNSKQIWSQYLPPSFKFIQTVLRKALKTSPDESINQLWKATSNSKNIKYDTYNSTKQVLKDFRSGQEDKLRNQLTCQGSFFTNITKFSLSQLTKIWSASQSKPPEKHIQLYDTIHQQLSSNPPKPFQMKLITNVRLSKMPSSRNTSTRSSWLSILPRTIHVETQFDTTFPSYKPADCERLMPLRRSSGVQKSVCHHW